MTVKQLTATLEGNMRFTAVNAAGRTLVMDDYEGGGGPSPIACWPPCFSPILSARPIRP